MANFVEIGFAVRMSCRAIQPVRPDGLRIDGAIVLIIYFETKADNIIFNFKLRDWIWMDYCVLQFCNV